MLYKYMEVAKMSLEVKGEAIKKNITLYSPDLERLKWIMDKYKDDASGTIRQLIRDKYNQENDRKAYKYDTGICKVCGKEADLYKGISPDNNLDIEERILECMCKVCISNKILNIK